MSFLDKTLVGGNLAFAFHLQLQQVQLQQVRTTCVKGLMSAEQHGGRDLGSSVCLLFFWRDIYTATFFSSFFFFPPELLRIQQNKYLYHMQTKIY